jgi:hypothetical protein
MVATSDEAFRLTPEEQPVFYAMVEAIHEGLIETRGCHHPKFQPNQCALVAKHLWDHGVRMAVPGHGE